MMKLLACIAVMLGTVQALHPALVTSCIAEQLSSGLDKVKTCLECFEAIEDPLSDEGVRTMKECSGAWLRRDSVECAWELNNLVTGDRQRMEDVISCFTDVRVVINAEQCLERIRAEEEQTVLQDLITGVLCLQESETNVTNILDILNHEKAMAQVTSLEQGPSLTEASSNEQLVDEDLADQIGSLVYQRHCNIASASAEDPDLAEAACVECFEAVTHPGQVPGPQEYVASLASCGGKHLAPEYDSCTLLLSELAEGNGNGTDDRNIGREIFLCFTRVVDVAQIQSCVKEMKITGETEVTAGTLLDVMVCNERINDKWVVDHININNIMITIEEEEVETTTLQQ